MFSAAKNESEFYDIKFTVKMLDLSAPKVLISELNYVCVEGGRVNNIEFALLDEDSASDKLELVVIEYPVYGDVYIDGANWEFTYKHRQVDRAGVRQDKMVVKATDGVRQSDEAVTIYFDILPGKIGTNSEKSHSNPKVFPITSLIIKNHQIEVSENSCTKITGISTQHNSSATVDLYIRAPKEYGHLQYNGKIYENLTIFEASLADLTNEQILYCYVDEEIGCQEKNDEILVSLVSEFSETEIVKMNVVILPVDNQRPVLKIIGDNRGYDRTGAGIVGGQGCHATVAEGGSLDLASYFLVMDRDTCDFDKITIHSRVANNEKSIGEIENAVPLYGYEQNRALREFLFSDLKSHKIRYRVLIHEGIEPIGDEMRFQACDTLSW